MSEIVQLYKYNMSSGITKSVSSSMNLSSRLSRKLLHCAMIVLQWLPQRLHRINYCRELGVWHTSIVVFGAEYSYGDTGVTITEPVSDPDQQVNQKVTLGKTKVTQDDLENHVNMLRRETFLASSYNAISLNCNKFSNYISVYLLGNEIPLSGNVI